MGKRKYSEEDLEAFRKLAKAKTLEAIGFASAEAVEAGTGWYAVANAYAQDLAGDEMSTGRAAAIMAVLSPMVTWANNLGDATAVVQGEEPTYALGSNIAKAERLMAGESLTDVIGGRKVNAFWLNISNPLHSVAVTLDTHMAELFGVDPSDVFQTFGVYDALSLGVSDAAQDEGLRPCQAQAIAWLVQSGRDEHGQDLPDPF
jgi:hypothetical protein